MSEIYEKAMAAEQAQNAGQALANGYPQPRPTQAEVIEFLTIQLGNALMERNSLRGRVWQLEAVNNEMWLRRQEQVDTIVEMRSEIADLQQQLKDRAPEKQFVVIGCFGSGARTERPMEMLSCASANGQTRIRVDARVKRRKRVDGAG